MKLEMKSKMKNSGNLAFMVLLLVGVVALGGCISEEKETIEKNKDNQGINKTNFTDQEQLESKKSCPYECCPEGEFSIKPCPTNYECVNHGCVDKGCPEGFFKSVEPYDKKLEEYCAIKKNLYWTSKEWDKLNSLSLECKEYTLTAIVNLKNLKRDTTSNECLNRINAEIENKEAQNSEWEYTYHLSYALIQNWDDYDALNYINNNAKPKMQNIIFHLYILKKEYSKYYSINEDAVENYKQMNQGYNQLYDIFYKDFDAKYFLQVDANDPTVIYQTDRLTSGLGGNDKEISWKIFNFVRDNIQYKHDPNWKTDWVQSPAITLFSGEGDCDDFAVLLASMFMRAGMSDVGLCFSDKHAWINANGYGWDATCKNCESSVPNELIGTGKCYEINNYRERIGKCDEGTTFGTCSSVIIGYYCDQGKLIPWCDKCGCSPKFPYCFENKCVSCPRGTVLYNNGRCRAP